MLQPFWTKRGRGCIDYVDAQKEGEEKHTPELGTQTCWFKEM